MTNISDLLLTDISDLLQKIIDNQNQQNNILSQLMATKPIQLPAEKVPADVQRILDKEFKGKKLEELDGWDWARLLIKYPELAYLCDEYNGWEKMDGEDCALVLFRQPQLENKLNNQG